MRLYAQHGALQGDKTETGIEKGYIDGVIYSPRDITPSQLRTQIKRIAQVNGSAEQFFDPQYYAAFNVNHPEARLSRLESCEEYHCYFQKRRRRQLEGEPELIKADIKNCLELQGQFDLTGVVAPNILVSQSLDSIEAVIAKNFIRYAGGVYSQSSWKREQPLYVTLALSREALMDKKELIDFLTDITL